VNRAVRWIRTYMSGKKEERPEQIRLDHAEQIRLGHTEQRRMGHEIMQFLVKRETSLADALEALTAVKLNALRAKYGERDEFSRFFEQVSTFLGSTERELAVVGLIPRPGTPKVQPRTVTMVERPEGIHRLAIEVGEILNKCRPKNLDDGLNTLNSTMLTAIEATCGRERADEFDLLLAGFAAKVISGGRVQ
jgi:hypothetical protein